MKLYRAIDCNLTQTNNLHAKKQGIFNEALNLIKARAFSPSLSYLKNFPDYYDWDDSTFYYPSQMVKFFYPSLIDACTWIDRGDFLVLEIDLPEERIANFWGVGFYLKNKMELCLPYKDLYALTSKKAPDFFNEILNFYEMGEPLDYKKISKKLNPNLIVPNLTIDNSNFLYPYLCFLSDIDFSILYLSINDDFIKYALTIESQRPDSFTNQLMKNSKPNYPYFIQEGLPFLAEENRKAKRVLKQMNKSFTSLHH